MLGKVDARAIRSEAAAVWAAVAVLLTGGAAGASDRALGQYLSSECVTCHQLSGNYQGIPPIVGWPEQSFVEIMNEYRNKKRSNAVMQTVVAKLSDEDVAALASYFGSITAAGGTPAPASNANTRKRK
jgi:cytochrome c553